MRYLRQMDVVPADKLEQLSVVVVGTGAIGRQVALQLTSIGVNKIILIDFDKVEEHNLPVQGFKESQLGKLKVEAVASDCKELNSKLEVSAVSQKYSIDEHSIMGDVFFSCVDSIPARKEIFHSTKTKVFIDGRMSAEEMRILTVHDPESAKTYPKTLEGTFKEAPCTAKSTIYCANVAAGVMIQQFTKWLRGMEIDKDIRFSLIGSTIFIT